MSSKCCFIRSPISFPFNCLAFLVAAPFLSTISPSLSAPFLPHAPRSLLPPNPLILSSILPTWTVPTLISPTFFLVFTFPSMRVGPTQLTSHFRLHRPSAISRITSHPGRYYLDKNWCARDAYSLLIPKEWSQGEPVKPTFRNGPVRLGESMTRNIDPPHTTCNVFTLQISSPARVAEIYHSRRDGASRHRGRARRLHHLPPHRVFSSRKRVTQSPTTSPQRLNRRMGASLRCNKILTVVNVGMAVHRCVDSSLHPPVLH